MKKIWMLLTGALLSVCLWMGIGTPLAARAQDVTLERGEEVYYEKYSTFYYYIDGELGYCLEPEKNSPHGGTFPADLLDNELDKLEKEVAPYKEQDEDVLSYALFPQVAMDFFKYRQAQQTKVDETAADTKNGAYPV